MAHAHAPHATALGLVADRIPLVLAELAVRAGGAVPVIPYVPAGTWAMGEAVRDALAAGGVRASSSAITAWSPQGPTSLSALWALTATEEAARIALLARPAGEPPELDGPEVERLRVLGGLAARAG